MTKKASTTPATGVTTKDGKGKTTQFANGSIFAMNCTGEVTVTVAAGTSLSITTASCSMEDKETAALRYRPTTDLGEELQSVVLCLFEEQHCTVSGLNLTCEGPKTFELSTTAACAASVCGSVSRTGSSNVVQEKDDMVIDEKIPPVGVPQCAAFNDEHSMKRAPPFATSYAFESWKLSENERYPRRCCRVTGCKKRVRTYCKCSPGEWLCNEHYAEHLFIARSDDE